MMTSWGQRNLDVFEGVGPVFINGPANSEQVPCVVLGDKAI